MTLQFKLPEAFKKQWLEDLRSGKYNQGRQYLRRDSELLGAATCFWCCLGVAANQLDPDGWRPFLRESHKGHYNWHNGHSMPDATAVFNANEQVYNALRQPLPPEMKMDGCSTVEGLLARMNDSGDSFIEIAAWIEEHL